ncbi:MAG: protein kinase [Methanomicrobiales archaeon]|nr:protein kinase [Methanomicrobiales archaeon]
MAEKGIASRASQVTGGACRPRPLMLAAAILLLAWGALAAGCTSAPLPGSVAVTSQPAGAAVYLDEQYQGTTPLEIANLTPGTYLIRLRMEGYGDREVPVVVEAGNLTSVTARYPPLPTPTPTATPAVTTVPTTPPFPFVTETPAPGALSLTSFPTGATVTMNGIRMGTTPLVIRNLTPGTYHVRYSLVGWDDSISVLSVSSGQTMTDYVTLRQ